MVSSPSAATAGQPPLEQSPPKQQLPEQPLPDQLVPEQPMSKSKVKIKTFVPKVLRLNGKVLLLF
jgi:hypothetical protein